MRCDNRGDIGACHSFFIALQPQCHASQVCPTRRRPNGRNCKGSLEVNCFSGGVDPPRKAPVAAACHVKRPLQTQCKPDYSLFAGTFFSPSFFLSTRPDLATPGMSQEISLSNNVRGKYEMTAEFEIDVMSTGPTPLTVQAIQYARLFVFRVCFQAPAR